jgi:hypothetical protein
MIRFVGLVAVVTLAAALLVACSSSGEASEPVQFPVNSTSEAGSSAISATEIDADSCAGVLAPIEGELALFTDSLTSTVSASQPQIESMYSAMYDTGLPGREFLAVVVMQFKSDDSSVDHYELMKGAFVESGVAISEINNSDENLIDQVSGLMDRDGIGRTIVIRQREWLLSISVGPTMAEAPWGVGDMEAIGRGVLARVSG